MTDDTTLTDADLERLEQIRKQFAKRGTPGNVTGYCESCGEVMERTEYE